jgi:Holliday junction DNA helicase RuvA
MIARLKGVLSSKSADRLIVDVQGVGYEVLIPFSTYYELGEAGDSIDLLIYTYVREDTLKLYGFRTEKEKQLFLLLIQISGIGPRLGIAILSGLPVEELVAAVSASDIARLSSIPGVGKKTAQRIALELKDRISALFPELPSGAQHAITSSTQRDVISALVNLGYPKNKAETVVSRVLVEGEIDRFETLLKKSLQELSG